MIARLLKYAIKNILRNAFLSASSILILTLLMFFINILVVLHDVSLKLIDGVNEKLTISLYLKEEYSKNSIEVIDLLSDLKNTLPTIQASYKTKEEVLEEIRLKDPELVKILEKENPLPETITLKNIRLEEYEQLNLMIENKLFVFQTATQKDKDYFSSYTAQYDRIVKVIGILSTLQIGLYAIIAIFLISILVIVYSIIGNFIFYYKDEIYITRLV
jgi:cell division transport system permease protein